MLVINVRNVHEALPEAIYQLLRIGVQRESRNGPVLAAPVPVTTLYRNPLERVIFWPERDANPFFHLFEALWMLGGRDDVAFVRQFAQNMSLYSDDGVRFHGAYGHRWRKAFGFDQLRLIAERLKSNHEDRRQVLSMWEPTRDLNADQSNGKDYPCNLTVTFQVSEAGQLDMVVFNRSNDIVWGCYGANGVHFSVLLEYMAARVGVPVGRYWQISTNWHGYLKTLQPLQHLERHAGDPYSAHKTYNPYENDVAPRPLIEAGESPDEFDQDVAMFLDVGLGAMGYKSRFIRRVALPMLQAWQAYKSDSIDRHSRALEIVSTVAASDWRKAAGEWIERRHAKAKATVAI